MTAISLDIAHKKRPEPLAPGAAKLPLIGLTRAELVAALSQAGVPERQRPMRAASCARHARLRAGSHP